MPTPGSIVRNGKRYWWHVRLPGEQKRRAIPLVPDGGSLATDDPIVAEQLAATLYARAAANAPEAPRVKGLTVAGLVAAYQAYARQEYRNQKQLDKIRLAVSVLLRAESDGAMVATMPAESMGPLLLKGIRSAMIAEKLARTTINQRVNIIRKMFRWAGSEQIVPGSVHHALMTVEHLQAGRTSAKDSRKVAPVAEAWVKRTQVLLPKSLSDMIELQILTGMRSGELVTLRPCDLDRSGAIWIYAREKHKTAHLGHVRNVFIGPKAQKVLEPYLLRSPAAFCFTPAEAVAQRLAVRRLARKSPVQPSQVNRAKDEPLRKPGQMWGSVAYGRAIREAIRSANAKALAKDPKAQIIPHWHPHQLRHNAATNIAKQFGLSIARAVLGHKSLQMTAIYAEMDLLAATEAVKTLG